MDYHEAADFLFDLRRFQMKPGTESVRDLLSHLGDPHKGVTYVQVAGSNGKGSVSRMVESTLREAGHQVGLYTSPHFDDVRERIRVDGRKIPEAALCEFVETVEPYLVERAADGDPLTFFEVMTAMGLWHFGRQDIDFAVLEVGMGGELDATSVIDPTASAVTTVSLEHTQVLGDTIEEIVETKAAVAPETKPLVTGATGDALTALRDRAELLTVGGEDADVRAEYSGRVSHAESSVSLTGPDWAVEARIPLLGEHQAVNAGIAAALVHQVAEVDDETLIRGLRNAHWPGRFEVLQRDPLFVLDGAHNPSACETVAETLESFEYDDLHIVFAAMHDKDADAMVEALPTPDSVVTCRPNLDRAEDPEVLAAVFEQAGVDPDAVASTQSVAAAVEQATEHADENDCLLVVGSLFAVAEARTTRTRVEIPKTIEDVDEAEAVLEKSHVTDEGVWRMRGKGVHRALKTRVERRQAQYLKEEMLSLGGECGCSGVSNPGELIDVVLMGTLAQFKRLCRKLQDYPYGLPGLGEEIRQQLGIQVEPPSRGYPWEDGTSVMGILNVTPDSFHDGGAYFDPDDAIQRAEAMIDAGAEIIDIGGESTRPGADIVPVEEEINRVVPVVEALAGLDVHLSVDTRKAEVGRAALEAGADILNDVTGLEDPEMRFLAAEYDVPVIVMHSIDAPVIPGKSIDYDDVVEDVIDELRERVLLAEKAGIPREHVIVDPGLGFGKSQAENFELLGRLKEFEALGCPILIGHSHKSMFDLIDQPAGERLPATVAGSAIAADRGADIVRVHDVTENVAAVRAALAANDPDAFDD